MTWETNSLNICNPMNPGHWSRNYLHGVHRALATAAPSKAFVLPFLDCLLKKTLFSLFTIFKPGIWMCQETELLSGAKIQWILFTVCVAAVENGIHSRTGVKTLQQQEVVEVKAGAGGRLQPRITNLHM